MKLSRRSGSYGVFNKTGTRESSPQIEKYFVDAQDLLHRFEEMATGPRLHKKVFHVYGHGALGKSSLLTMCFRFCRANNILAAMANSEDINAPQELMASFAIGLKQNRVSFKEFDKTLEEYKKIQAKVTQIYKQTLVTNAEIGKELVEASGGVTKLFVPGAAGPLLDLGIHTTTAIIDVLSKFLSKEDVELYIKPEERLADKFLKGIQRTTLGECRIVLLLDTYEKIAGLDTWVLKWVERLPDNVLFVIAGRKQLGSEWFSGTRSAEVQSIEMKKMSSEALRSLVLKYLAFLGERDCNQRWIDQIVQFAGGLPLAATTAARVWTSTQPDFEIVKSKTIADVLAQLRCRIPDNLLPAVDAVSVVRVFNRDVVRGLVSSEIVDRIYDDLIMVPIVRERTDGFALHDVVMEYMTEYWRHNDPEYQRGLHQKALEYYTQVLEKMSGSAQDRDKIELEVSFQEYQLSPKDWIRAFRSRLEKFFVERRIDSCQRFLHDARTYVSDTVCEKWLRCFEAQIAMVEHVDAMAPRDKLQQLVEETNVDNELKVQALDVLAKSIWYDILIDRRDTDRARKLLSNLEALQRIRGDDEGRVKSIIWQGVLWQRTEGSGETYFRQGIELLKSTSLPHNEQLVAWIGRELSISLRMQGRFAESRELIHSSIDTFTRHHLDFENAHSLMNYGMLLVLMGSLHEAEAPLKESERLFGGAAHVGSYERAWPLISFGDIALRRGIYNEAERCYRQAATIWGGDLFGMAVCHGSLAELAVARGRWDDALELAEQSLQGRVESEDKFGIGWTLKVKGCALLGKGLMVEAIESFLEGQLYMQQYGSQFGDSELAVSICEAYARNHLFREFETSAQKLEQLANNGVRDRYHNHLARMGVLRGLVELYRRLDSSRTVDDEDWVRNVSSLFVNGLIEALQHNIFLLDSLIDMIQAAFVRNRWPLPFQRHICELICSLWQSSSIEGESVVSVERRSRIQQDIDGTHRGMLFDSLRNDRPALLLTID